MSEFDKRRRKPALIRTVPCVALLALGACSIPQRLAEVGAPPPINPIANPVLQPEYQPVSLPMPSATELPRQPNSLWRAGARSFFKDQRAAKVGDILTVRIQISDTATVNNSTSRSRTAGESSGVDNFLGYESRFADILPDAVAPGDLVKADSESTTDGEGSISRREAINITVAALVTQVLPNGNLVIQGRQEVRVNSEMRELLIAGVVRPEDISGTNTIDHSQIAEARISYGGRGILTDLQRPRYGQEIFDIIYPF